MLKWRYIRSFRMDTQYFLKILVIFNIFLGLYLLFLSTNNRRNTEYPHTHNDNEPIILNKTDQNDLKLLGDDKKLLKNNNETNKAKFLDQSKVQVIALKPPAPIDQSNLYVNEIINNDKTNIKTDQIVDKLFDSNNRPVVQELSNNNADSTFKRVEEDDKTLDENDKLRIEMLGIKSDEQNSIIHLDLNFNEKNKKSDNEDGKGASKEANDDLNKDLINQIIDHNSHLKKDNLKLIMPENVEPSTWIPEIRGKYSVLKDYILGNAPIETKTITLTTQGGPDFLYHAEELCSRWNGPISLSVYAPGDDFRLSINIIYYLRQCANKCVANQIFWHLIYDTKFPPAAKISGPTNFLETQNFNCSIPLDDLMSLLKIKSDFRKLNSLPYPINVLRNVARIASKTKYLLASDIELYPSIGIIPAFFELLDREKKGLVPVINPRLPHVYVLPIFEVKAGKKAPKTKQELSKLFKSNDAIFFHRYVCDLCQNFPDRSVWIKEVAKNNSLNIFAVTKRTHDRNQWEPLYIGTNDEPFYDERLTWEGKRDKMSQMYQMCLMNYDLLVLDNAFLVHAPGIKRYNSKDDKKRLTYIRQNHKIYTSVLSNLLKKYGNHNRC